MRNYTKTIFESIRKLIIVRLLFSSTSLFGQQIVWGKYFPNIGIGIFAKLMSKTISSMRAVIVGVLFSIGVLLFSVNLKAQVIPDSENALNFSGGTVLYDDVVVVNPIPNYLQGFNSFDYSFDAWLKPETIGTSSPGNNDHIYHLQSLTTYITSLSFAPNGELYFVAKIQGIDHEFQSNVPLLTNQWSHVAVTWDASAKIAKIYINGDEVTRNVNYPLVGSASSGNLVIGGMMIGSQGSRIFDGDMDELRFWQKVLEPCEVAANMHSKMTGSEQDLYLYYEFDEGVANGNNPGITTVPDVTGNGFDGTLQDFGLLAGSESNWVTSGVTLFSTGFQSILYITMNPTACYSYTSPSGNYTWSASGTYNDTVMNSPGCDSILTIHLTIINDSNIVINPIACYSYTSPSGNYIWTTSGTYQDTVIYANSCYTFYTINLTLGVSTTSTISPNACNSYTAPSGNHTWTQSGTYLDTITFPNGCDSILTINLTVYNTAVAGLGTLGAPVTYSAGSSLTAICNADFNEDGFPDLAVTNNSGGIGLNILTGNANGTFSNPYNASPGGNVVALANGDFDGDNHEDLVLIHDYSTPGTTGEISINNGDGSGYFSPFWDFIGTDPTSVTANDFDGSGYADFAVTSSTTDTLTIYGPLFWPYTTTSIAPNEYPLDVTSADFNGDGKIDLAVSSADSTISILLGAGNGSFGSVFATYLLNFEGKSIITDDFNNDGIPDLAVIELDYVAVLTGIGNGLFNFSGGSYIGWYNYPQDLIAADFNSDGNKDIAVASTNSYNNDGVSIILGNGNGTFDQATNYSGSGVSVTSGDYNSDGVSDVAMCGNNNVLVYLTNTGPSNQSTINPTACGSYISPSGNYTWTASGMYHDTLTNVVGCGTLYLTVDLTITNVIDTLVTHNETVCSSYTSPSGNYTWATSGIYLDTLPTSIGCDSVISINLTVNNTFSTINPTACDSYTSPSSLYTWTSGGTYFDTIPNSKGCDSIIMVNLFLLNSAQETPVLQTQKTYGGSSSDVAYAIQQTADGGFVLAGYTYSNNGDVTGLHGNYGNNTDMWVVKVDSTLNIQWQKALGGSSSESAYAITQTRDGGYIVVGDTRSSDGDVSNSNYGNGDWWVVKLSSSGSLEWENNYGGSRYETAYAVLQTADGGYFVAGSSTSWNGDKSQYFGNSDCWLLKLDANGNLLWDRSYGGSGIDGAQSMKKTADGGYILAGYSTSTDGHVTGNHGSYDYWVVKLDSAANIQWQKSLGGSNYDWAHSIDVTTDGGYIIAGYTGSSDGDVTGFNGEEDYWVVKLDQSGNLQWQKTLGGSTSDRASSIVQTYDMGYVVVGESESIDGDITDPLGNYDYWVVKLNPSGGLRWEKSLGGTFTDKGKSICLTNNGSLAIVGQSSSNNGDVSGNHGTYDYWLAILELQNDTIDFDACGSYTSPSGNYTWTSSGTYIDTILNAAGCDSIITINLTIGIGNSNQITINPTACNSYTSPSGNYTWTSSGTYMDTIPNSFGCDSIITVNLTINTNTNAVISPVACYSYTSPSGNYTWTSSGTYMDTIPNALGCDSFITVNLTVSPSFTTNIITDYVWCDNQGGFAEVTPSGGTPPYTYQWNNNNFSTTNQATGLATDWHLSNVLGFPLNSVTTTDASGCSVVDTFTIESAGLSGGEYLITYYDYCENSVCLEPNILPDLHFHYGVGGDYEVDWGNGLLQDTICVPLLFNSVTYYVTITDDYGCYSSAEATVSPGSPPMNVTISTQYSHCLDTVTLTANVQNGTGPFTYLWSTGSFNTSITTTTSGYYTVSVYDSYCSATASINLTINSNHTNSTINPVACSSYTSPSGNYIWTTSGTYMDTIQNAIGCDSFITVNLTINVGNLNLIFYSSDVSCNGANDGIGIVVVTGGTGAYTFDWGGVGNNPTDSINTGLTAGTYCVTVSDGNGCIDTSSSCLTITEPPAIVLTENTINVSCYGINDGTIYLPVSGGTPPYTYNWSNGDTTDLIVALSSGTYTVTVTDGAGCTVSDSSVITQPDSLTINAGNDTTICFGDTICTITPFISGGTAPYNYYWYQVNNPLYICVADSGSYVLEVTDDNSCWALDTLHVTVNNVWTVTLNPTACNSYTSPSGNYTWTQSGSYMDTIIGGGCDSVITVNLTINNNTTSIINPGVCFSYTSPSGNYIWTSSGTYMDTIPNASGCDSVITVNLTINYNSYSVINPTVCDSYTSPSGNYIWTTSGTYMDTIPIALGCVSIITVNLTINGATTSVISPSACNSYTAPSGSYTWTQSGNYIDTIPSSFGCDSIITINLTLSPLSDVINLVNDRYLTCGLSCIRLNANTPSGPGSYNYSWSTGKTTKNIRVCPTATTTYSLTVTDASGCTLSDTAIVIVSDTLCEAGRVTICRTIRNRELSFCIDTAQLAYYLSQGATLGCCANGHHLTQGPGGLGGLFSQVYPNPFTFKTTIEFGSEQTEYVTIEIFNNIGQRVANPFNGSIEALNIYKVEFIRGNLPTGIYISKITSAKGEVNYHKLFISN